MSFTSDARREIAAVIPERDCCRRAAAYGAACFARRFDSDGLLIRTDGEEAAEYIRQVFLYCGIEGTVTAAGTPDHPRREFSSAEGEKLCALFLRSPRDVALRIDPRMMHCSRCAAHFFAGAFLCGGSLTDPSKEYNLSFTTPRAGLSRDLEGLLAEHEYDPRRTERDNGYSVMLRSGERISALLRSMGAEKTAGACESVRNVNSIRNSVNRRTNCDAANLKKTARANAPALKAARYLMEECSASALPQDVKETAELRLENPEMSLAELAACFCPPISRSGLVHRLEKMKNTAEELQAARERGGSL